MIIRVLQILILSAVLLVLAPGCGDSSTAQVHGKVTVDGKPFFGTIYMKPPTGQIKSAPVQNGVYRLNDGPIGKVKVYVAPLEIPGFGLQQWAGLIESQQKGDLAKQKPVAGKAVPGGLKAEDLPGIIASKLVEEKYLTAEKTPFEPDFKGGSNPPYDVKLTAGKEMPILQKKEQMTGEK